MCPSETNTNAYVIELLDDFFLRPASSAEPYGSLRRGPDGVMLTPGSLTDEDARLLQENVGAITSFVKQFIGRDILAERAGGSNRSALVRATLDFAVDALENTAVEPDVIEVWSRALKLARMHGKATHDQLVLLEAGLVEKLLAPQPELRTVWLADLLRAQKLAKHWAAAIAVHLRSLAGEATDDASASFFFQAAAEWHHQAGDEEAASDDLLSVVLCRQRLAAALLQQGRADSSIKAASELQLAHDVVRQLSRAYRESRGVQNLGAELAASIRVARQTTVSFMTSRVTQVDVSEAYERTMRSMTGRSDAEAAERFLEVATLPSFTLARDRAETAVHAFPFGRVRRERLTNDGRQVANTDGDQFGIPGGVWQRMVDDLTGQVVGTVRRFLMPAWQVLSTEHRLSRSYFVETARSKGLVPGERAQMYGRALFYGFDGDFMTAAQLLTPQLEHLVRVHLRDAGVATIVLKGGIETEVGLSALMEKPESTEIFGEDVAFVIRALFCSPAGLNLRNEFAHGLFLASTEFSAAAMYAWWLMWRLAASSFSNPAIKVDSGI
ncbi:uncharacterized protein DUF4209 [Rathayibacter sp. PhB152]|uniref:DUF4209 domain-containing protein n=1 Tax=Rathayibacter sp. PhB152 TaxID=2485190 RepID=UPI000F4B0E81|nr:DUF4209 domain-containing protein [Rathayibacter sp. PhB152]ROQ54840.1 uncharacterized protein DUF4209 [Rathayibacter sp. PhB152]